MNTLNEDVLLDIFSYSQPEDIYMLYKTSLKTIIDELIMHSAFIIKCNHIIDQNYLRWFQHKQIKLHLVEEKRIKTLGEEWYRNGVLHRDDDLPAVDYKNGVQIWYQNGKKHRNGDKPAKIGLGDQEWYINNKRHRDNDLPACIWRSGTLEWYQNGHLHRDNDLPAITKESSNYQAWYQNGQKHRDGNLPAEIHYTHQRWFHYGKEFKSKGRYKNWHY